MLGKSESNPLVTIALGPEFPPKARLAAAEVALRAMAYGTVVLTALEALRAGMS